MEGAVNSLISLLVLIFDVGRGFLEWAGKAALTGVGAGVGAYLGVRAARNRPFPIVRAPGSR